jgi:hypothetical protein
MFNNFVKTMNKNNFLWFIMLLNKYSKSLNKNHNHENYNA